MLIERLKAEGQLHRDESGWKENGEKRWIGAFRAKKYAVFVIRDSRREKVLEEILGKGFKGITEAALPLCWAHCIREVLFLLKIEDEAVRRYGRRVIKQIGLMFETIHRKGEIGGKSGRR
jgi:hypothetical protein